MRRVSMRVDACFRAAQTRRGDGDAGRTGAGLGRAVVACGFGAACGGAADGAGGVRGRGSGIIGD